MAHSFAEGNGGSSAFSHDRSYAGKLLVLAVLDWGSLGLHYLIFLSLGSCWTACYGLRRGPAVTRLGRVRHRQAYEQKSTGDPDFSWGNARPEIRVTS